MKVLLVTTEFPPTPGGVATVAYEQAQGLAKLGHEVTVLAAYPPGGPVPAVAGVQPANYTFIPLRTRSGAILRLVPLFIHLWKHARRLKPHVIWTPTYRGFGLPVMMVASMLRVPYGVYLHGSEIRTEVRQKVRRFIMHRVLAGARLLVTNSTNTARIVSDAFQGLPAEPRPITPGVHAEKFEGLEEEARQYRKQVLAHRAFSDEIIIFVALCRMSRQKGIDFVLRALSQLDSAEREKVHFLAVGDGPDLEAFQQLSRNLNVAETVTFAGGLPYAQAQVALVAGDVYMQPSQPVGDFLESFGISFLEAQAAGLPCIGTLWGGVPEAVREGETAILVPPANIDSITEAIRFFLPTENRERFCQTGQEWARQNSWNAHCGKLTDALQSLPA